MPLQIVRQNIANMNADAVVHTVKEEIADRFGVDSAVYNADEESDAVSFGLVSLSPVDASITDGCGLNAKYVIHISVPASVSDLHDDIFILKSCYEQALRLATDYGCQSVAIPLIASDLCGYPKDQVLPYAVRIISGFLYEHDLLVYLCVSDRNSYEFNRQMFAEICEVIYTDTQERSLLIESSANSSIADCCAAPMAYESEPLPVKEATAPFSQRAKKKNAGANRQSLHDYMQNMDKSFAYKLFDLIDERGMTDVQCYKKANIDKKTFSKIKCNPDTYRPSKQTAVAFAIALELNPEQTQELLASAGLTLSSSFVFDKIILYFLQKGIYDIFVINEALFEFDQILLGC